MRNLKKFLALVLAMMMAFSLMVTANAQNAKKDYDDIEGATFSEAIDVLTGMGVFKGNDGNFGPQRPITRAEAVAVLYRLVTGDVTDARAELYAPAANFVDVAPNAWYAGYVGFAVDAELVKGYNGYFMPNQNVTGYEMLAMLLRAVGYGKNGEFTGSQWMVNVGARAESLDIVKTIKSSNYANTLAQPSAREVVAELTFQTATKVPTVTWTMLGGYNEYPTILQSPPKNPTLGVREFGLTNYTGIIVGNQETGEDDTIIAMTGNTIKFKDGGTAAEYKVAAKYAYAYPGTSVQTDAATSTVTEGNGKNVSDGDDVVTEGLYLDIETGLNLYGHKVKVWYDGDNHAYAVIDKAKSAIVYAADLNPAAAGKLGAAAKAEGFNPNKNASTIQWSTEYSKFKGTAATEQSKIKMYSVIDNTGNGGIDAIIRLNAEVAKVTETKTTAVPQTIKLGDKKASTFKANNTAETVGTLVVSGNNNQVIGEFDITKALGKVFTVWQVLGTTADGDNFTDTNAPAKTDYYVLKTPLKTVTGTVTTYTLATAGDNTSPVTSVKLATGEEIKRSGILEGSKAIAYSAADGRIGENISAGTTYTFIVDDLGRYVHITAPSEDKFLYTTYADFQYGAMGTGEINYKVYGVDWDGEKINDRDLTWMYTDDAYGPNETAGTLGVGYKDHLDTTKKDMSTNSVQPGSNQGFMINEKGEMVKGGDGEQLVHGSDANQLISWTVTSVNAANGFAKVANQKTDNADETTGTDYMLTNDTVFYVVSGFGVNATVKTYKGLKELIGDGTSAVISYAANDDNGPDDEVWFQTGEYQYDSITTGNNNTITKVILSDTNLRNYSAQNLYFSAPKNTKTDVQMAGTADEHINQYKLWLNGVEGTYWIKDNDSDNSAVGDNDNGTFYTLSQVSVRNGMPIYKVEAVTTKTVANGGTCNVGLTYTYVMVNNYNKAQIGDEILNVDGAVVADVEFKTGDHADKDKAVESRTEINTVEKLNKAVSTNYTVKVAIVNSGIDVSTIYVINDGVAET